MYKLQKITDTDSMLAIQPDGLVVVDIRLGNSLEFKLWLSPHGFAYHVTMIEATIDGVMARFNKGTAQVSTPHGLVNFITQQLCVFNFDKVTIGTLSSTVDTIWCANLAENITTKEARIS